MRVFVTGAAGYVGSAIARAFVEAGHDVTGMHHSPESEERVAGLGAVPVAGEIARGSGWKDAAADQDVVVHAAFDPGDPAGTDRAAIDALLEHSRAAVEERRLIYTSGCWVLGDTGDVPAAEDAPVDRPAEVVAWRPAHERAVLEAGGGAFVTAVVRPGMVYGGRGGLVNRFFETAVHEGAVAHVGDGTNRWSLVHRDDLGRLYVGIAEAGARGIFHGVDGRPVEVAEAARAASEAGGAGGRTIEVPVEEAREEMGPVADALILDQALATERAGEVGWEPRWSSFLDRVEDAWDAWRAGGEPVRPGAQSAGSKPRTS